MNAWTATCAVDRRPPELASSPETVRAPALVDAAKRVYAARRRRDRLFAAAGIRFADAQWDMLLDLFIASSAGRSVSVSSACIAASVPPTTALRTVERLHDASAITLQPDPNDGRRRFVLMTPAAFELMIDALSAF